MFDLQAYRAAHRPWQFAADGRVFRARHVSAFDVLRWQEALGDAKRERDRVRAVRALLRRAFPWRPSYLVRGDPVRIILSLEPKARAEALKDFFVYLWGPSATLPQTNGTRSSSRTSLRTA